MRGHSGLRGEPRRIRTLLLAVPLLFAIAVAPTAAGTLAQATDTTTLQAPVSDEQAGQPLGAEAAEREPAAASAAPAPPPTSAGSTAPALAERSEPPGRRTAAPPEPTATASAPPAGMVLPPAVGPLPLFPRPMLGPPLPLFPPPLLPPAPAA